MTDKERHQVALMMIKSSGDREAVKDFDFTVATDLAYELINIAISDRYQQETRVDAAMKACQHIAQSQLNITAPIDLATGKPIV